MALPHLAINEAVRVCDGCHLKLKMYKTGQGSLPRPPSSAPSPSLPAPAPPPTTANSDLDAYDDDLKKAIELSLAEDEKRRNGFGTGYQASSSVSNTSYAPSQPEPTDVSIHQKAVSF
jgi:growth factor-regulated tyrosine kinase substrate